MIVPLGIKFRRSLIQRDEFKMKGYQLEVEDHLRVEMDLCFPSFPMLSLEALKV